MTTAEKIYRTVKELPEPALREVLDFAKRIQNHFKDLNAENIPIPTRQLSRTPPSFEE